MIKLQQLKEEAMEKYKKKILKEKAERMLIRYSARIQEIYYGSVTDEKFTLKDIIDAFIDQAYEEGKKEVLEELKKN